MTNHTWLRYDAATHRKTYIKLFDALNRLSIDIEDMLLKPFIDKID